MKKQFLSLGKALNRAEQKSINGGRIGTGRCSATPDCDGYYCCVDSFCVDSRTMNPPCEI